MKKYKVGYIAGVFDLFHIGHLNLLRRAKEQCGHLIVGVLVDELAVACKNKKPFIPFEERIQIVESIKYVDQAVTVVQETLDKMVAWEKYRFDCLFSGDDWRGHPVWIMEEKKLNALGAEIMFFTYTKSISSTQLRQAINESKSEV
ncbi:adenylyltransferase/cytidyltransferase family protein [Brevibacillus centrosporus]|uniref:adenylyltransferase/cytidyltransferase family protein n=1 Tax=Brevibacillus centrosporus TaxID=54910 RepID=UPI002E1CD201|nr:adenylyltransferase/cytidyltransferase family protein [Brevibacillus centrosporus]MED1952365.1 adenylyltransferase/cytidyltransferase family protein [Brevibacillus centrosporus]